MSFRAPTGHSAATWRLAAGLVIHSVADLLGHNDPTLVLKLCGHALKRDHNTAGDTLERFLRTTATAL